MDRATWEEHWRAGKIGFHLAEVNPRLIRQAAAFLPEPAAGSRVLVPLCGKSHDLAWLAARGHEVVGVEFVEAGARAFFTEHQLEPEELHVGGQPALRAGGVTIVVGDFFAVDPVAFGRFPAVWDRAALVALEPDRQRPYLELMRRLAADDARLLLIGLDHDLPGEGPPFKLPPARLAEVSDDLFRFEPLEGEDILDVETRFRDRGATFMVETAYLGRPLPPGGAQRR